MKRFKQTTEETDQWDLGPGFTDTSLTRIKMGLYQSSGFFKSTNHTGLIHQFSRLFM